ncbi:hypothetical protein OE88DRAFT_1739359 [Heliocybe sulcata]|uniref:Uncharacterized protein n=1 Tax=Heliocybe sulcata TaxID=5364 RepID=A0A5C3MQ19_9AGAM|nr:hypothetical protein OE88DRAFT_1739359 [Heliocybe sulcata]
MAHRKPWALGETRDWLQVQLPRFKKAQDDKDLVGFWRQILEEYFDRFPVILSAEEEAESEMVRKALKQEQEEKWSNQVKNWFNNNRNIGKTGDNRKKVLRLISEKKKRIPSQQAFQRLYWDQISPLLNERMPEFEDLAHGPRKAKRLALQREIAETLLAEASDEVKERVEKERENGGHADVSEEGDERVKKALLYQDGIDCLHKTLQTAFSSWSQQTGFAFTVLAGGPCPQLGGKIMSFSVSEGQTGRGNDFEHCISDFEKRIMEPFEKFLVKVFPPDVCEECSLCEPREYEDKDIENVTDQDCTSPKSPKKSKSKASRSLDTSRSRSHSHPHSRSRARPKPSKRTKSSKTRAHHDSDSESEPEDPKVTSKGKSDRDQSRSDEEDEMEEEDEEDSSDEDQDMRERARRKLTRKAKHRADRKSSPHKPSSASSTEDSESETELQGAKGRKKNGDVEKRVSERNGCKVAKAPGSKDTVRASGDRGNSTLSKSIPRSKLDSTNPWKRKAGEAEADSTPSQPGRQSSEPLPAAAAGLSSPSKMPRFRGMEEQVEGWRGTVKHWVLLEDLMGHPDAKDHAHWLPAAKRVEEIHRWNSVGKPWDKKLMPKIADLKKYKKGWREWWVSMQPDWRVQSGKWPLDRELSHDDDWAILGRAGPNGVFGTLMSLSWWFYALQEGQRFDQEGEQFMEAFDDVDWVIRRMIEGLYNDKSALRARLDSQRARKRRKTN